jgi:hypothetical protein
VATGRSSFGVIKGDIEAENSYFWNTNLTLSISSLGPTPQKATPQKHASSNVKKVYPSRGACSVLGAGERLSNRPCEL